MGNRDGLEFDLRTVRFLRDRWKTDEGERVKQQVLGDLRRGAGVRGVLNRYWLDHSENASPYEFPYYPADAMKPGEFWVLHEDDLRGIEFWEEDLSGLNGLEKANLAYSTFWHCRLDDTALSLMGLTHARFYNCSMVGACFAMSGGVEVRFEKCDLTNAEFIDSGFDSIWFTECDLSSIYWEGAHLGNMHIDHATIVTTKFRRSWRDRTLPGRQIADLLRYFRQAYSHAEIWHRADAFFYVERRARRRYLLQPSGRQWFSPSILGRWLGDIGSEIFYGYGVRLANVLGSAAVVGVLFAALYFALGTPEPVASVQARALQALYFSFTTFATLGYGDLHYPSNLPWLRLLSTLEAIVGAIMIASVVAVLARKHMR
jgi:hypothetical protein